MSTTTDDNLMRVSSVNVQKSLLDADGVFHSNANLFKLHAPLYWQLGLPVFPLKARSKEASLFKQWNQLAKRMPTPQEQQYWLTNWPDCNIGLPLGPQSGCVAIDIDTDDPTLIQIITYVCGQSPWQRVGKKGMVMLYKYTGEKPFKIKDINGKMICECLSIGNQVVLPPSIHPDTQKPYVCNVPLYQVYHALKPLPANFEETLRDALKQAGVSLSHSGWTRTTDYVSQGSRDVKMTTMAGFYANGVTRGELTLLEAIDRLRAWKEACVENVAGDDIDIEKGVRNLIQFLIQDVLGPKNKPLPKGWDDGLTEQQKKDWCLDFSVDHIEWDVTQVLDYLDISVNGMDDPVRKISTFDYILQRVAHSPNIKSTEIDLILNKMVALSPKGSTKATYRARLNELSQGELKGENHTEIAESLLKDVQKAGEIKFWQDNFWQWQGSNWEKITKESLLKTVAKEYGHLPVCKRQSDHKGIVEILKAMVATTSLNTVNERGINFANGFLDQDGVLHEHKPCYGCVYTLPYRYIPELADSHPKFDALLEKVWGHFPDYKERVRALQEVICATVFGIGTSFARAVLLYGTAGSGKSQILDIVRYLLPDQVVSYIPPYDFDSDFKLTELSTSLLNICGELKTTKYIPDAEFKSAVDGSSFAGQYKYGQVFSFKPLSTHWFASNHLPKSRDTSMGFFRRWIIFTFDKVIKDDEKIRNYGEQIVAEEREGIMAWAVACVQDLVKKGDYDLPPSHSEVVRNMMSANDSVYFYLISNDGPIISEKSTQRVAISQLYERYSNFCYVSAKVKPIGLRAFLSRITDLSSQLNYEVDGLEVIGMEVK